MKSHLFPSGDVSLTIYREFREAAPPTEVAYRKWLDATSDRYGIPVQDLRAILANQEVQFIRKARNVVDTEAEVAGRFIGATLEKAIGVLNDQLGAEKWRPFTDKEGRLITEPCGGCAGEGRTKADGEQRYRKCKECDGKGGHVTYLRTPDNAARLAAIEKVLKIWGAFKPEKLEIDGHIIFQELSVHDIGARLKRLLPKLIELRAEPDPAGVGPAGTGEPLPRIEGEESDSMPLVLDDEMHQNNGRTGPLEPVQAVPPEDLLEVCAGLPDAREEQNQIHP